MNSSDNRDIMGANDVTYTITTQGATYPNEAIEASVIVDIVTGFETDFDDFIVLEPSAPVGESVYMQAVPSPESGEGFTVELRLEHADGAFRHYSYSTTDKNEVIRMCLDYWGMQKLPDLTQWEDVTDQF